MSKHDNNWGAAGQANGTELPAPLAGLAGVAREDALIRFLAAAADWEAAGRQLSGAFAEEEALQFRRQQEK